MRKVVGLFCMLALLRGLVSTHGCFNFCTLAACGASWLRPVGLTCDWWAVVNIHIHILPHK